jgi:hypothetical protein
VLAEEIAVGGPIAEALSRFSNRRWERCRMVAENSIQLGEWEKQPTPDADPAALTNASWAALAAPI